MRTYRIPREVTVSEQDLDYIVDAAVNYCAYWCDLLTFGKEPDSELDAMSEALSHGGTLKFHIDEPFEEGGKTEFELTTSKLLKALEKYENFDFEDYDGPMADGVVQTALFGEVVYG